MPIAGAIAASFFNPDDGTTVQLNHIDPQSRFKLNNIYEQDIDGQNRKVSQQASLELGISDLEGIEQLKLWANNDTKLNFVLAGLQENILWYRPATIKIKNPYSFATGNRNFRRIIMQTEEQATSKIWTGVNILNGVVLTRGFNAGWADEDDNNIANGYTISEGSQTFENNAQSITNNTDVESGIYINFEFPLRLSTSILLSTQFTQLHSEGNYLSVEFLEYTAATIGRADSTKITNTGRKNMSFSTPANCYSINVFVNYLNFVSSSEQSTIKYPALRTDDSDRYIAG